MSRPTDEQRIAETLREYAAKEVPGDLDPWPVIRDQISGASPVLIQMQSLPGQESREIQRRPNTGKWRKPAALSGFVAGVAMVAALVLLVALVSNNRVTSQRNDDESGPFVPAGKVRHIVMTDTTVSNQPNSAWLDPTRSSAHWEMWYANGTKHLLMYSVYSEPGRGRASSDVETRTVQVADDAVYEYYEVGPNPSADTVSKYRFNPGWLGGVVPDPQVISNSLKPPNSRIIGNTVLDGRPVVEIESTKQEHDNLGVAPPDQQIEQRVWVDTGANRIVQWQFVTRVITGPQAGLVTTDTAKVILYELQETSAFPADFFRFKPPAGATVIEKDDPLAQPSPTVLTAP